MYEFERNTEVDYLSGGSWKRGKIERGCSSGSSCLYIVNTLTDETAHCLVQNVRYITGAPLIESNSVGEYRTVKSMTELTKTQKSFLDEDTQALVEAGFINTDLSGLTEKGAKTILQFVLEENKVSIVALAKELVKEEKKTNKS